MEKIHYFLFVYFYQYEKHTILQTYMLYYFQHIMECLFNLYVEYVRKGEILVIYK